MTEQRVKFARSFDDVLGPSSGRYFGDGYQQVGRQVDPLRRSPHTQRFSTTAHLQYPERWSTKASFSTLVPHLSSIDALWIASTCARAVIGATLEEPAESVIVTSFQVSAGGTPTEDLSAVPAIFDVVEWATPSAGCHVTRIKFTIGFMRGQIALAHSVSAVHIADGPEVVDSVLAPTRSIVDVGEISVTSGLDGDDSSDSGYISAVGSLPRDAKGRPSMLDALVVSAQLAEILLYEIDDLTRESSGTLWMRKLALTRAPHLEHSPTGTFPIELATTRTSVINTMGRTWRSANLSLTSFAGQTATCLVAHALPERER